MSATACDCIVIGGGPAGLTAALYLARYRRRVVLVDGGDSRAAMIPNSHNYPGFVAGIGGRALLDSLNTQLSGYPAEIVVGEVLALRSEGGFVAETPLRQLRAPYVILAAGIVDRHPVMAGLEPAIAAGVVRYCPVCDAYEAQDLRLAVIGDGLDAAQKAVFLRSYARDITWLRPAALPPPAEALAVLEGSGVGVVNGVSGLALKDGGVDATGPAGRLRYDVLYPAMGCEVRSGLAAGLGARTTPIGALEVDAQQQTSVDGLYAAGDVVSDLHQIAVGTAHAAVAATRIHRRLPRNFR
jgi:thioredoxin reductase (NADPH)